jgi:hypothetical protein
MRSDLNFTARKTEFLGAYYVSRAGLGQRRSRYRVTATRAVTVETLAESRRKPENRPPPDCRSREG